MVGNFLYRNLYINASRKLAAFEGLPFDDATRRAILGGSYIDGRNIEFVDGSREEFDCIVAATGFATEFPFLSEALLPT